LYATDAGNMQVTGECYQATMPRASASLRAAIPSSARTCQLDARAQSRGLVTPDAAADDTKTCPPIAWNGREFKVVKDSQKGVRQPFSYCHGERMVGQSEQPCASTTKLVASRHRFVNAPDNSKEGYLWHPGHRYTNRV
jgi:hypothetical protein